MTSFSSSWLGAAPVAKHLWLCMLALGTLTGCGPAPLASTESGNVVASADQQPGRSTGAASARADDNRRRRPAEADEEYSTPDRRDDKAAGDDKTSTKVPAKVTRVLRYIDEHHRAPDGYEGGRVFHNSARNGEQALPRTDPNGRAINYHEWDVNRKVAGVNRGAERLVTGSDGSAFYTSDHYRTFTKVR